MKGLSSEAIGQVRRIEALLARGRSAEARVPEGQEPVEALLADGESRNAVWEALAAVHGLLDEALQDGAPGDEVESYRRQVLRLGRRVAEVSVREEGAAYRQLLRDVSHDIRSPLNSILFLADGLLSEENGPLNDVQRRQMGVVYSAAASLLNLVNDLLDFARTAAGDEEQTITRVPFSVENTLSDVMHLLAPIADHHGTRLAFEVEVDGPRVGDPQILSRVLLNLASNALEASRSGGEVLVTVGEEDDGRTLRVDVDDDGEGVELEKVRKLLRSEPGTRATRMLQGRTHGLGLIICGRMVRAAGGDLDVGHREVGGSRFTLRLPFPQA